jgi:hypothetical protein
MEGVEKKLQRGETLLPVDDRTLLHEAGRTLDLLKNDSAKEVGLVLGVGIAEKALRNSSYVVPKRLPLTLFVPNVRTLK